MLRTCDRCGVGDDYYMMYYAFNKDNVANVICDECAEDHKDEYTDITPVHLIEDNFKRRKENGTV